MDARPAAARAAALLAIASVALSVAVAASGGFQIAVGGVRLSVRSWPGPAVLAALAAAVAWVLPAGAAGRRLMRLWLADPHQSAPPLAALLSAAIVATGLSGGLWTAAGADASGYVAEARMFAAGRLSVDAPLARQLRVPAAADLVAPLGFRPAAGAGSAGRLVPTYPPGLPLLMTPLVWLNAGAGPFLLVPIAGGLAIWLAFAMGRAFGHPGAGLAAACLLATFPPFLHQLLQPMSDVPVTAAWLASALAALTRRRASSGLLAGLAVLIRPNLALTSLPLAVCAIAAMPRTDLAARTRAGTRWAAGWAPALVALAALQAGWYGAPWRSGYGEATDLFALASVGPNLQRYGTWWLETGGLLSVPVLWALVRPPSSGGTRTAATALVCAALATVLAYLPYYAFEQWHYLRFLLPAVALLLPLGAAAMWAAWPTRVSPIAAMVLAALAVTAQSAWQLRVAADRDVFRLPRIEQRYQLTANWLVDHTPDTAVIICAQQSGSVALNASRAVLRWDLAPPDSLDDMAGAIDATGRAPWLVIEGWERDAFAARHGRTRLGALDWPPAAVVRSTAQVHVYRAADRAAFLSGASVPTDYVGHTSR